MHKIKIAFDLDGCLINMVTPIKRLLMKIHGIELKDDDPKYVQFDLSIPTGLSKNEMWKIYRMVYKEVKTIPIYTGSTELLTKLWEKTDEPPLILTSRPFDAANDTYAIVKRVMKKTPFALILKHERCHKSDYLQGYQYYVEDRRKTAIELSTKGFYIPLVRKNYNFIQDKYNYPLISYIDGVRSLIPNIDSFIE